MKTIYLTSSSTPIHPSPLAFSHCPDITVVPHEPLSHHPSPVAYLQSLISLHLPNVVYSDSIHTHFHLLSTNLPSTSSSPIIGLVHYNPSPSVSPFTHFFHQRLFSSLVSYDLEEVYPHVKL